MRHAADSRTGRICRVLGQAASLSLWRRPRSRVELLGFGAFLAACALALLAFGLQDRLGAEPPSAFYYEAWHTHAGYFLALLAGAWLATRLLERAALWLSLATMAALVGIPWTAAALFAEDRLLDAPWFQLAAWRALLSLAGFVALFRLVGFLSDAKALRRLAATLALALVAAAPWYWQQSAWFWLQPEEAAAPEADSQAPLPIPPPVSPHKLPPSPALVDAESTLYRQPGLLRRALESIRAQRPGKIDLYSVGFAGDGSEQVFRNEVEFFATLMADRFDARAHTLSLVNSPRTAATVPLATLSNLRAGLAGVAARMDTNEDLLVLFLTSHGSDDHQLYVNMPPLPLRQIRPQDLRAALDDAGIRWRVVVVSACYSGGFIDALRDPRTLVITAARADRTSFGCGSESRITWFGHAFVAEALNQTTDFERAFALADRRIRSWELAQGETPSVPQMAAGAKIGAKLAAWRAQVPPPGQPVPFTPR
ncbi:MAG: C13 family peptidase [Arenimonas sp.]